MIVYIFWFALLTGAAAFTLLFSILFEKLIYSNLLDDPVMGKGFSVLTACVALGTIFGFLTKGGDSFNPDAFIPFGIAAIFVGAFFIRQGFKLRGMQAELQAGLGQARHGEDIARHFD